MIEPPQILRRAASAFAFGVLLSMPISATPAMATTGDSEWVDAFSDLNRDTLMSVTRPGGANGAATQTGAGQGRANNPGAAGNDGRGRAARRGWFPPPPRGGCWWFQRACIRASRGEQTGAQPDAGSETNPEATTEEERERKPWFRRWLPSLRTGS